MELYDKLSMWIILAISQEKGMLSLKLRFAYILKILVFWLKNCNKTNSTCQNFIFITVITCVIHISQFWKDGCNIVWMLSQRVEKTRNYIFPLPSWTLHNPGDVKQTWPSWLFLPTISNTARDQCKITAWHKNIRTSLCCSLQFWW